MTIDEVIESLKTATEGSAELDLLCMKALGEAPEESEVVGGMPCFGPRGDWRIDCPSMPCTCKGDHIGGIIQRTRSLDSTEKIKGEWTSMVQRSWPKHNGWTVGIGGSILKIRGEHKSLAVARTIAVLREFQRFNFPRQDPCPADKEIQLKGNNNED